MGECENDKKIAGRLAALEARVAALEEAQVFDSNVAVGVAWLEGNLALLKLPAWTAVEEAVSACNISRRAAEQAVSIWRNKPRAR